MRSRHNRRYYCRWTLVQGDLDSCGMLVQDPGRSSEDHSLCLPSPELRPQSVLRTQTPPRHSFSACGSPGNRRFGRSPPIPLCRCNGTVCQQNQREAVDILHQSQRELEGTFLPFVRGPYAASSAPRFPCQCLSLTRSSSRACRFRIRLNVPSRLRRTSGAVGKEL